MDAMGLFAVIALKDNAAAVDEAVSRNIAADISYKIESGKWIVNSTHTTAKELTVSLGLRENYAHIALAVRGYSGRAQPDLWEWLSAQSEK